MQVKDDAVGTIEWSFGIASTIARAHQHADTHPPPAPPRPSPPDPAGGERAVAVSGGGCAGA
ncbi:hypothetical protein [Nonomuraea sp. NPDC048916]|uniref:hypothetical protein n=1 Tax=Nonomuraea sp. NPDC048916 TaxID=3154232 RepID=UPI0033DC8102